MEEVHKTITVFKAFDGNEFATRQQCVRHDGLGFITKKLAEYRLAFDIVALYSARTELLEMLKELDRIENGHKYFAVDGGNLQLLSTEQVLGQYPSAEVKEWVTSDERRSFHSSKFVLIRL